MPEQKLQDWQCPALEATPERRNSWVIEQVEEGGSWWRSQETYGYDDRNMRLLGTGEGTGLKSNNIKANIRKFVETISDIREIGTLGTSAEQLKEIVEIENQVIQAICRESHFPRQDRKCLQWAVAARRGYMWPRFIRDGFGYGEGKFVFEDLPGNAVLPSQLPQDNDIQGAYAVTINHFLGIAEAHARYPKYQSELLPVSKIKPQNNNHVRRLETVDRWRYGNQSNWDQRFCEFNWTFVRDVRINDTGNMYPMGDKGTSWYYEVPSLGQVISWIDPTTNLPTSRTATQEDCRLYPQLRLIITNPGMSRPIYDGPAFDWHGMMPPVAYDVDDWPWLAVGYSLMGDIADLERAQRFYLDLMYRVAKVNMNPPMGYDLDSGIPREDLKNMDMLDESGTKIGISGMPQNALQSVLPDTVKVRAEDFKMLELLNDMQSKTLGLNDMSSLEKLKLNLSSDNVDKLLETIGPVAKGIATNMEVAHSKIVMMLKYMIPQYLTTARAMAYAGPDAVQLQVLDFQPESLVPSHLPSEQALKDSKQSSNYTRIQRAKWAAENLVVTSVPSQLLNVTHMQEQLKYLNLFQQKAPIPFCEVAKQLGIKNWGESPGATLFEKWKWEQREMAEAQVETMQAVAGEMPMGAPPAAATPPTSKPKEGRPPTAQAPPKLEQRGTTTGKPRTIISQSK